jgi:hypothetical protein
MRKSLMPIESLVIGPFSYAASGALLRRHLVNFCFAIDTGNSNCRQTID